MAESSSSSNVEEVSNAMAALDVSSPGTSTAPVAPSEQYHKIDFWKKFPIGMVQPADVKLVMAATIDLCHALLLQEPRDIVMEKAALLAVQFRNFDEPSKLLVDHDQLQQFFAFNSDIRLDLTEGNGKRFVKGVCKWKDDFITSVEELNETNYFLFGPVFASVLLRMGRHGVQSVALKMSKLGNKRYGKTALLLKMPSQQQLVSLLSKYARAKPSKVLVNTIYGGLMCAFHKQDLDTPTQGWLDFLALQSMRFFDMPLVSMINELFRHEQTYYRKLFFELTVSRAFHSWKANHRRYTELSDDPFWPYSKTFSEKVFQDMTYRANHWLCNVIAFLLDTAYHPEVIIEWPTLGPTYQNLVKFTDSSLHMTLDDYEAAKHIEFTLEYESRRPLTSVLKTIMNDNSTKRYGPNSKWHYP